MSSMRIIAAAVLAASLLAGCKTATTGPGPRVPEASAPPRIAGTDRAPDPVAEENPPAPHETSAESPPPPPPPLAVPLETDPEFVGRMLPAEDPGRYRKWRQKGKIRVGHTHLDTAELSPDGAYLLVMSGMESTIRIYERATKRRVGNYSVPGFSPGSFERGDVLFWPSMIRGYAFLIGNTRGLNLYSTLTGEHLETLDDRQVWDMRWSPDGRYLVCNLSDIGTQTSRLTFFEIGPEGDLAEIRSVAMEERVDDWALSPDNTLMAVTYYPSDTLELVDLRTGTVMWTVSAPRYSNSIDFSPDGRKIAIGGNHLVVMDRDDPTRHGVYERFNNNIHRVRFSPSGDVVATSAYDGHVRIVSVEPVKGKLELIKDLRHGGTANVYTVVFLEDGSGLISTSGDKTVRYWGK